MAYFTHLGNVWHTLPTGEKIYINDITKFADVVAAMKNDPRYYIQDNVEPHVRPEIYSYRLYGSVEYWWTIFVMNDMVDFSESWPRTQPQLEEYMNEKYFGMDAGELVLYYLDADGFIKQISDFREEYGLYVESDNEIINLFKLEAVTAREYETERNEKKRLKKFIDPNRISDIQARFERLMAQ